MSVAPESQSNAPYAAPSGEVRTALEAMLASESFGKAERPARFLRHLVEQTLRGETQGLKESLLGIDVFGRDSSFDPRLDPVVRQEAARLRKRIARYYEAENPDAGLRIEIPVGTYIPVFLKHAESPMVDSEPAAEMRATAPLVFPKAKPVPRLRIALAVALLALAGAAVVWRLETPAPADARSIAVLPFVNLSGAAGDQYFADGLTDEITDELAQAKSLKVVARTSAFQFRGKTSDIRAIGRQLSVAYAVEGNVERFENRVRVSAHLERVADGSHVWSKTYERQSADLFAMQSELAAEIASRLKTSLGGENRRKHVVSAPAHDLYMQGRYELEQMTPDSVARAAGTLQQAVTKDPEYAAAYYLLGQAKWNQPLASDSQQVLPVRRESAALYRKALELDPDLGAAHAGLANYLMQYEWDWAGAEKELRAGLTGTPTVAVENSYAYLLVFRNRFAEADEHIRLSQELDPIGNISMANRAQLWNLEGRFLRSREEFQRMLQKSPTLIPPQYMIALTYIEEGHPAEGMPILEALRPRTPVAPMVLAMAAAREGRRQEALSLMRPFEERYPGAGAANQWFALAYAFMGDEANTIKWLNRSVDAHEWQALNLGVHPAFAFLRKSADFQALKTRIGLGE